MLFPHRRTKSINADAPWRFTRRSLRLLVFGGIVSIVTAVFVFWPPNPSISLPVSLPILPPLYPDYFDFEDHLPQHDPTLPAPEGSHAKFLWVKNHVTNAGWGNVMQEMLHNAHLAYLANRSFVFDTYTWEPNGKDYRVDHKGLLLPNRYPMSTMITGPAVGGPFPPGVNVPRAVSRKYYESVCPTPTIINTQSVHDALPNAPNDVWIKKWVEVLNGIEDQCVEIDIKALPVFDIWMFGSPRVLASWSDIFKSPIFTNFGWSDLVVSAVEANRRLFWEPNRSRLPVVIKGFPIYPSHHPSAPIPGLLALHLRRGDYLEHCQNLAEWGSTFLGYNSFPSFIDQFTPSTKSGGARNALYASACFPTIEDIVHKVQEVRATPLGSTLNRVYIMTNGDRAWVASLAEALRRQKPDWVVITNKRELLLTHEQMYVAQAIDMLIGDRAQVFIGNGFSSLSSNVAMFRMLKGFPEESIRHW